MAAALVNASIAAKVTADEKRDFLETCSLIGTTPSNAIRMFVSAFNRNGGFPFNPSNPRGFSNETLTAMDDAVSRRNLAGPFDSTAEMWDSIFDDEE